MGVIPKEQSISETVFGIFCNKTLHEMHLPLIPSLVEVSSIYIVRTGRGFTQFHLRRLNLICLLSDEDLEIFV